ncbi:oxidoreductase [Streptomyces hygroscopicus subsp. jinggangensis 5008]|nr:oxidoreductase [Streptomyces hygroscopicus subsp. jinggangensis 5008]AGF67911.1 oxidoreductase [Streptomyces hygroscopicus subsp. jinggangensis TL01]
MSRVQDLLLTAPGELHAAHRVPPLPALGADDVLVEVDRITLCGSDHRLYDGTYGGPRAYPIRFGHEWSGRVVDTGRDGAALLGQWVTGDCSRWCGDCAGCSGDRNLCRHIEKFGITVDGFSSRLKVVDRRYLYPDTCALGAGLLALTEFFAVADHGLRRLAPGADDDVLVIGAGALGLASYLILTGHYGVRSVRLLEADPAKAQRVRELFPAALVETPPPPDDRDTGYAGLAEGADHPVVVECSGSRAGLNTALTLARPGGRVLCFGLRRSTEIRTDLLVVKGLTLIGSIGGTGSFPAVHAFLDAHRDQAARLVTHRFPADAAEQAFAAPVTGGRAAARIKTQIVFGEEDQ